MEYVLIITIAIVIFSLIFDFINGFHDTANAIATAVSTRALTPRTAIFLAAIMNFIGALTFTGVAGTITDIVDPFKLHNGLVVVSRYFSKRIIWNLLTWFYVFQVHHLNALIGSIAGNDRAGQDLVYFTIKVFTKIIIVLIISPIIAFCVGFIMYTIVKIVLKMLTLPSES